MKSTIAIVALLAATALAACNTVQGVGRDVSAGGQAIEEVAEETERVINPQPPAPVYQVY